MTAAVLGVVFCTLCAACSTGAAIAAWVARRDAERARDRARIAEDTLRRVLGGAGRG